MALLKKNSPAQDEPERFCEIQISATRKACVDQVRSVPQNLRRFLLLLSGLFGCPPQLRTLPIGQRTLTIDHYPACHLFSRAFLHNVYKFWKHSRNEASVILDEWFFFFLESVTIFVKERSAIAVVGLARFGSLFSMSVMDVLSLGSSLSLRSFNRLGALGLWLAASPCKLNKTTHSHMIM